MASDSSILSRERGIWPSPEGSDVRLPGAASAGGGGGGGGDAISGLDEQQAHKEGIHGSSFPKGLLEEEEWYDGSLIDEMKDLSYPSSLGPPAPAHSHCQAHHKPESGGCFNQLDPSAHPFVVGRSSSNSSFHQERRSFSSFLDAPVPLEESSGMISAGFLSDFSAGLLPPPHPPPPPPPPVVLRNGFSAANGQQQQQHHHQLFNVPLGSSSHQQQQNGGMFSPHTGFLGDTLGNLAGSNPMLDFSPSFFAPGGFNSSNATSNSGGGGGGTFGNFSGIGSSLSIGMMPKNNGGVGVFGECFGGEGLSSSKEASFKASCKHTGSGQSSPSTIIKSPAFGSADSSLELADDPAAATTTSPKRKTQKEKKSPAAAASAEDVAQAGASALDLDLREDEEMEDGSGLLCENDEAMGGHHKGPGGKGNRKGLPAKNLMAERRRRKKLNDRLYMLRSVVPKITKMDRASILGDAIEYLKELLQRINDLHTELEGPADAPMPLSPSPSPSLAGMQQPPPPLAPAMIPQAYPPCVKEECGASAATPMIAGPQEMQPAKVDVRTRDGKTINIHMFCSKRPGLLLSTMRALDGLGLDVQQAVISCFNGFVLDVFRAEQFRDEIAAEEIKAVLLQTAACHDTIVPT